MNAISTLVTFVAITSLGLLAACASTKVTSELNPEMSGRTYTNVLVYADIADLEYRKEIEQEFCDRITSKTSSACLQSAQVFFPGQPYTADDISKRIAELHVDGVLMLKASSGVSSSYVPPTTYTTGTATVYGNTISGQSTTQTFGGYNVNKPWANYQVSFWSVADNKVAWYGSGKSRGNAFAEWSDLIESAAKETVSSMLDDGLLKEHN